MFLGLDISTSITGVSLINEKGEVLLCDHIDTRKAKNFFEKAELVKQYFKNHKHTQSKVKEIWVEQSLHTFRSGFSSAQTLSTLARFNGVVSWIAYKFYSLEPNYIAASSARKLSGITIKRGEKAKEKVFKFLLDNEPAFEVEYTKHGNPRPGYYDRADSLIIAKAARELWKQKNLIS